MSDTRILLAEDETITRMDLREMLENLGYAVVGEAGDGVAAVNMARALKPDLVLMDIKMPGSTASAPPRRWPRSTSRPSCCSPRTPTRSSSIARSTPGSWATWSSRSPKRS